MREKCQRRWGRLFGNGGMHEWSWLWFVIPTLFLVSVVGLGAWAMARGIGWRERDGGSDARAILARRYAAGEIDREDYERRRRDLSGPI